jgi:hypothetical protein
MPRKRERKFAEDTTTPVEETQGAIREIIVKKLGGTQYAFGYDQEHQREIVSFKTAGIPALLTIPMAKDERERMRLWRCIYMHIKNIWVSIDLGMVTIEQALIPYFLLPNNKTLGEILPARIRQAITTGKIPALLPGIPSPEDEEY